MGKLKFLAAGVLSAFSVPAFATAFYIAAHPDDIELFMARNAAYDVWSGAKVVFVVVSAGDKLGDIQSGWLPDPDIPVTDPNNPPKPYPLTREMGHHAALQYLFSLRGTPSVQQTAAYVTIAGKSVQKTLVGSATSNVIMYNLRLPDQYSSTIASSPVTVIGGPYDPKPTYSAQDLQAVLNGIIALEHDANDSWVNIQDSSASLADDHADHITTASYVKSALQSYAAGSPTYCVHTIEWRGYPNGTAAINYTSAEQVWQLDVWNALNNTMVANGGPDTRNSDHQKFLYKIYQNNLAPGSYGPCH